MDFSSLEIKFLYDIKEDHNYATKWTESKSVQPCPVFISRNCFIRWVFGMTVVFFLNKTVTEKVIDMPQKRTIPLVRRIP